jgi:ABC-type lipopolysaccharide export system ATPase subunit
LLPQDGPIRSLSSGMSRPIHAFKIGQQVYYHPGGGKRTGPYTIIGLVRQSSGVILFKIKSASCEQLAKASELKLALKRE